MGSFQWLLGVTLLLCSTIAAPSLAAAEDDAEGETVAAPAGVALPDETIVITATRTARRLDRVGSTIRVIDAEDLARHQDQLVIEALERVPGLTVRRDGNRPGSRASVFMRGADSDQTLVLVDGVRLHDPSAPNREAFLDHLGVDEIERIEVLSGPQSLLYGSDAIGGVINIITRKGQGAPNGTVRFTGGSFKTLDGSVAVRGGGDAYHYAANVRLAESDGFSSSSVGDPDDDGYQNTSASLRMGLGDDDLGIEGAFRFIDARTEVDGFGAPASDTRQYALSIAPHWALFDGAWRQKLTYSLHQAERENGAVFVTAFDSDLHVLDWQNTVDWSDSQGTVFGAQFQHEGAHFAGGFAPPTDEQASMGAVYFDQQVALGSAVDVTAGLRVEMHERYGSNLTGRTTAVVRVFDTGGAFHGSLGSGFKAPTLAQLFDDSFGSANPDLEPERSTGWDIGYRQRFGSRASFDITGFWNEIDDLILGDPNNSFRNENIESVRTRGLELALDLVLLDGFRWLGDLRGQLGYTRTDARAQESASFGVSDGERLLRRPKHEVSSNFVWAPLVPLEFTLGVYYVGERFDLDPVTFSRIRVDSYVRVDLAYSFALTEQLKLFARIDNVGNAQYEDVAGFETSGRAYYGGVRFDFE